jgi:LuxR family maltose regulon positive regulatory protein
MEKLGHCFLARVYLARGDLANALDSIRRAEKAHPGSAPSVDMRGGEYPKVRLWLKQNNLVQVEAWLGENAPDPSQTAHFKTKLTYTMHARALIALSRERPRGTSLADALHLLEGLLELAESHGWGNKLIEILVLQALALEEQGDTARAMAALERALGLAEPEGFTRTFVDEGPPVAHLLYEALARGILPGYVSQLIAALPKPKATPTAPSKTSKSEISQSQILEPLSERELEVLQLIAKGLTNPEIAARLYLSLNTVKAHTRNIYGKLDVHSRTQAAARARALDILKSLPGRLE